MGEMFAALGKETLDSITTFQARVLIVGLYMDVWTLSSIVSIRGSHAARASGKVLLDLLQKWMGLLKSLDETVSADFSISSENPVEHDPLALNAITFYRVCQVQLRINLSPVDFLRGIDQHDGNTSNITSSIRKRITRSPDTTEAMRFCYESLRNLLGQGSKFLEIVPVFMTWGVEQAPLSVGFCVLLACWLSELPHCSTVDDFDQREYELVLDIFQLLRDSGIDADVNTNLPWLVTGSWSQVMSKMSPWAITNKLHKAITFCQQDFATGAT